MNEYPRSFPHRNQTCYPGPIPLRDDDFGIKKLPNLFFYCWEESRIDMPERLDKRISTWLQRDFMLYDLCIVGFEVFIFPSKNFLEFLEQFKVVTFLFFGQIFRQSDHLGFVGHAQIMLLNFFFFRLDGWSGGNIIFFEKLFQRDQASRNEVTL